MGSAAFDAGMGLFPGLVQIAHADRQDRKEGDPPQNNVESRADQRVHGYAPAAPPSSERTHNSLNSGDSLDHSETRIRLPDFDPRLGVPERHEHKLFID